MSVVAVKIYKDKIVIGADSFVGFNYDTQLKDKNVKIFSHKEITIGTVGYTTDCSLMRVFSRDKKPSRSDEEAMTEYIVEFIDWCKKKDVNYKMESNFMIVFKSKAFLVAGLYVKQIKKYEAMGAGMNMAQTALALGKSVREALEIACELSIYCEKPLNIYEIKK